MTKENRKDTIVMRTIDAPRNRVWNAWTDPKQLAKWWGPPGAVINITSFDLRPGGTFLYSAAMGTNTLWAKFVYKEVHSKEKIVFVNSFSNEKGGITPNPWIQGWPLSILTTITLAEQGKKTILTIAATPIDASPEENETFTKNAPGMKQGFAGAFERLDAHLGVKPTVMQGKEFVITRVFDAPRERVWKAWTTPELIKKWWGPEQFSCPVAKVDLRPGGKYLYCMRGLVEPYLGRDLYSGGTFREIIPKERIVLTDHFADEHGNKVPASTHGLSPDFPGEMQVIITFADEGHEKTRLSITYTLPESAKAREAMQLSGMEIGWNSSLDKLARLLA